MKVKLHGNNYLFWWILHTLILYCWTRLGTWVDIVWMMDLKALWWRLYFCRYYPHYIYSCLRKFQFTYVQVQNRVPWPCIRWRLIDSSGTPVRAAMSYRAGCTPRVPSGRRLRCWWVWNGQFRRWFLCPWTRHTCTELVGWLLRWKGQCKLMMILMIRNRFSLDSISKAPNRHACVNT